MNEEYTIGVLSDPHSNFQALEAVLEDMADKYPVTKILCVGDIVGYYTEPSKVLRLVQEVCDHIVRGNHDDAAARNYLHPDFNIFAAAALKYSIDHLSNQEKKILYNLPPILTFPLENEEGKSTMVQMVHGSPEYPLDYYVFDSGKETPSQDQLELAEYMDLCELDILTLGHTHRPFVRKVDERLLLNPGSAGQPRDGDNRPSYVVLDPFNKEGKVERVTYDIETTIQLIKEAELPRQLGERLRRGK